MISNRLRHPAVVTGLVMLACIVAFAAIGPFAISTSPLATDLGHTLAPVSWAHPLGTDQYGRDVFARIVWGAHVSLEVAASVVFISLSLGTLIGALAGFIGGWPERVVVSVINVMMAFPGFLLALALVAARGSSLESVIFAVSAAYTPRVASVMRAVVLTVKPRTFIEASESIGLSRTRILLRHVIPNSLPPVIVVGTVSAATAILGEAGLSYLGLGVQPPTPTWGNIIADGQQYLSSNPLICLSAGAFIAFTVIALNILGDGLRDVLDPTNRKNTSAKLL
jgi:peptide/nickel transport system permease protein